MAISRRDFIKGLLGGAIALTSLRRSLTKEIASLPDINGRKHPYDEKYWALVRTHFILDREVIYLNNGSLGPSPKSVLFAVHHRMRLLAQNPTYYMWSVLLPHLEEVRRKAASFLGVSADEIAFPRSTTEGMSIVAAGLPLKRGDEVLTTNQEHPGGLCCWQLKAKRDGILLKKFKVPTPPKSKEEILNRLEDQITKRTRVISVAHILFTTGLVLPVKEICDLAHQKGILVVLDGAHPVGMIDVNIPQIGCDFYATSPHKWLLAPKGTGILYVKKDLFKRLWPSIASSGWEDTKSARRYERYGTRNIPEALGVGDAIDFQNIIGKDRVERRGRELATYLKKRLLEIDGVKLLTPMDPEMSAAITAFSIRDIPYDKIMDRLRERYNIVSRGIPDGGLNAVRLSTHIYNTYDQVDKAVEVIEDIARRDG